MAKDFIAAATDNDGKHPFKKKAEAAGMSTSAFAHLHEHSPGKLGEEARLALTLMGLRHDDSLAKRLHPKHKS